jgi:hypothetical protein
LRTKIIFVSILFFCCLNIFAESTKEQIIYDLNDYFEWSLFANDSTLVIDQLSDRKWEIHILSKTLRSMLTSSIDRTCFNDVGFYSSYSIIIELNGKNTQYFLKVIYNNNDDKTEIVPIFVTNIKSINFLSFKQSKAYDIARNDFKNLLSNPESTSIFGCFNEISDYNINIFNVDNLYFVKFKEIGEVMDGGVTYVLNEKFEIIRRILGNYLNNRKLRKFEFIKDK